MIEAVERKTVVVGDRVTFENDQGPQVGNVIGIQRNICNAQPFAIIEVDDILPGILMSAAIADIELASNEIYHQAQRRKCDK
ncbi:hypothetical protein V8G57_24980 [Collimonas sp. H4R21]|uniref:Uncharacterized protein n=1 Tax=Collimonas rhizosphaerae TaxID=3126357 RepID=A0ABU9Q3A4_9BURK